MTNAELIELATKQEENFSSEEEQEEIPQTTKQAALEALCVLNYFYKASNASVADLAAFQHVEAFVVQNVTNKKKQMSIDTFQK
ncbi:hypothetical protein PR048_010287 [Dryococelus australis]|uniref:Uncharacterized protein n=1 Tax=Dryococelus australis TaxID=614101 RepID=A0ABQ9I2B5_9NEOP|nr:hypothetical protein PR048_010287 [Dryococelus australis]